MRIEAGPDIWQAAQAIFCGGDDFETLYPELFAGSAIDASCK